jgi:ABC-type multidrug transport system fused ATPase/permease subunit
MIKEKMANLIRVITVAPIMALVLLITLFLHAPLTFGNRLTFVMNVVFLVSIPLLAYPLQPFFRKFKDGGREGQRKLAMYFAVAGYVGGLIFAIASGANKDVLVIYIAYLISGSLVALINKMLHFRASGHACGVAGPFLLLIYFGQPIGYLGIGVLVITWLASLYMKRHTWPQLLAGNMIPFISLALVTMLPFG